MDVLNRSAIGQPDEKAIAHRLLVVEQGVEFETVAGAAGIDNYRG